MATEWEASQCDGASALAALVALAIDGVDFAGGGAAIDSITLLAEVSVRHSRRRNGREERPGRDCQKCKQAHAEQVTIFLGFLGSAQNEIGQKTGSAASKDRVRGKKEIEEKKRTIEKVITSVTLTGNNHLHLYGAFQCLPSCTAHGYGSSPTTQHRPTLKYHVPCRRCSTSVHSGVHHTCSRVEQMGLGTRHGTTYARCQLHLLHLRGPVFGTAGSPEPPAHYGTANLESGHRPPSRPLRLRTVLAKRLRCTHGLSRLEPKEPTCQPASLPACLYPNLLQYPPNLCHTRPVTLLDWNLTGEKVDRAASTTTIHTVLGVDYTHTRHLVAKSPQLYFASSPAHHEAQARNLLSTLLASVERLLV